MMPSLFIAHGSPMLALEDHEYTQALQQAGEKIGKPRAIVLFSAHWENTTLSITSTDETYEMIYDFYGFPQELYQVVYPAKGSSLLAAQLQQLYEAEGIPVKLDEKRGLDHGAWVILRHLFRSADIPVVTVSVNPLLSPQEQYRIGKVIAKLREQNILVIGSGSTVHTFRRPLGSGEWAHEFDNWLIQKIREWDTDALFAYKELAPHAVLATPDYEHFLPVLIAMGSGEPTRKPTLLHQSYPHFPFGAFSHVAIQFD